MINSSIRYSPYPDFVAAIGQENCPPGGSNTVSQWLSWMSEHAQGCPYRILDLACSTGFSGREFSKRLNHDFLVKGIDISREAIEAAQLHSVNDKRFEYQISDATELPFADNSFDIILAGCNFAFIENRSAAIVEARRVLRPGGLLFVANFYYETNPTPGILETVKDAVGFTPSPTWTRLYWEVFFSSQFNLSDTLDKALNEDSSFTIFKFCFWSALAADRYDFTAYERYQIFRRLFKIRTTLNRHRRFQRLRIDSWRVPE